MNRPSKPNLLGAIISASISLALTGQSATAENRTIPFTELSTTGASATCRFAILGKAASLYCKISDTRRDGNKVYVEWGVGSYIGPLSTKEEYGDADVEYNGVAGTTATKTDRTVVPLGSPDINYIYWRVCRDVANTNSDNCSSRYLL